jgi:hypothetical protein
MYLNQPLRLLVIILLLVTASLVFFVPKAGAFNMGYHYQIIRDALLKEGFNDDALKMVLLGNSYVDLFQEDATSNLLDNYFCERAKELVDVFHFDGLPNKDFINVYYKRLLTNTYEEVRQLVSANDPQGLLLLIGITSHILEDFYAHSNWAELDIGSYVNIPDATYFDIYYRLEILDKAINDNSALGLQRYGAEYSEESLFTHTYAPPNLPQYKRPSHDVLKKDYAGSPYFDWAYRSAYRATSQWVFLIKSWVNNTALWSEVKAYSVPSSDKTSLVNATSFEGGLMYWLCTFGGAWTNPENWKITDILGMNPHLPDVQGFGLGTQGIPLYGQKWFSIAAVIAKNLFELKENEPNKGKIERLVSAFQEVAFIGVNYVYEDNLYTEGFNNQAINPLNFTYLTLAVGQPKWLKIKIPAVVDMDTGGGAGINNEDPGGTSDYYPKIYIDGVLFQESEYVDRSSFYGVWQVLKPIWDVNKKVNIKIELWESDPGPDEQMDISPTDRYGIDLDFNVATNTFDYFYLDSDLTRNFHLPDGFYFTIRGNNSDYSARIYVNAGLMSNNRVEVITKTMNKDGADTKDLVWLDVSGYSFLLSKVDYLQRLYSSEWLWDWGIPHDAGDKPHNAFNKGETNIFTFDPGLNWNLNDFYKIYISKDKLKNDSWGLDSINIKVGKNAYFKSGLINAWLDGTSSLPLEKPQGGKISTTLKALDYKTENLKSISVFTELSNDSDAGTNDKVYLTLFDKNGNILSKGTLLIDYWLADNLKNIYRSGECENSPLKEFDVRGLRNFFYDKFISPLDSLKISDVAKIRIEKPVGTNNLKIRKLRIFINDKLLFENYSSSQIIELKANSTKWEYIPIQLSTPIPTLMPLKFKIEAQAGSGGEISPSGTVTVDQFTNKTLTFTPNTGYLVKDVLIDGVSSGTMNSYTFERVNRNHTISVSFIKIELYQEPFVLHLQNVKYVIATLSSKGGTVTPSGKVDISPGKTQKFEFNPLLGYKVKNVFVDGVSIEAINSYTFENVKANHSLIVVFASSKFVEIMLKVDGPFIEVNGIKQKIDEQGTKTIIKNSRTLIPIRAIVESLGGTISWNNDERKVTISLGSITIELWINKNIAKVNGVEKMIDPTNQNVIPEIINGRTMIPLRFVTENLGCDVQWDGTTQTITITYQVP